MAIVRVVVQARTSSTRLPGKALLPVAGYPSAILAALRASHSDWHTVLATSDTPSDEGLARLAGSFGLNVVRGPLKDVLARFVMATDDLPDDAIIIRLTADNLFPDHNLLSEIVKHFVRQQCDFLFTWSPSLDVPYGLSMELFRTSSLRRANDQAMETSDREHVTPWIRRTFGVKTYRPLGLPNGSGRLRCTIDTFDDYIRIEKVFKGLSDPIRAPWRNLCSRLEKLPGTPSFTVPQREKKGRIHSTFVLGTAQLGGAYGIANKIGAPSPEVAQTIVRTAIHYGVTHVDTARAYGRSEHHIGSALAGGIGTEDLKLNLPDTGVSPVTAHVVTKLQPMEDLPQDISTKYIVNMVDKSVFRSCRELRIFTIPTLLLHRAGDRTRFSGMVWRRLLELKEQGVIGNLGVSASTPQEALDALNEPDISHVQIPFNILDWRWKEAGVDIAIAQKRPDVTIHARSPLLQGLLVAENPNIWPRIPQVRPDHIMTQLNQMANELNRKSVIDLAFSYVRSHRWIDGVVSGLESVNQLTHTLRLFTLPELEPEMIQWIDSRRDTPPIDLLDPAQWLR